MLPVWIIVVPTVTYGVLKYMSNILVSKSVKHLLTMYEVHKLRKTGAIPKDFNYPSSSDNERLEAVSDLTASSVSDTILFPLEIIMHRLYLQGTRTIIDNLDTGISVMPILTGYVGPVDCFITTVAQEGRLGLLKGFGALLLQSMIVGVLYKVVKISLVKIVDAYASSSNHSSQTLINPQNNQINVPEHPEVSRIELPYITPLMRSTSFML